MRVPFGRFLNRLFQSDHAIGGKMLGGAAVTTFLVLVRIVRVGQNNQLQFNAATANIGWLALNSAALGAGLVLVLSIRDEAARRRERGEPIGRLLRLLAGRGCLWSFLGSVALVVTLVIIGLVERAKG